MPLEQLEVMQELQRAMDRVTPEHMERFTTKRLTQICDADKPLDRLHSQDTRKLFVAASLLAMDHEEFGAKANAAMNDIDEAEFMQRSKKASTLASIMRSLFFAQLAADMNHWADHLGIRAGWMAVLPAPSAGNPFTHLFKLGMPEGPE